MAKTTTPEADAEDDGASDRMLIEKSRPAVLVNHAERTLKTLARKIEAARDAARARDDEEAVKQLGAALRRLRSEARRRSELDADPDAEGAPDDKPATKPGQVARAAAAAARAPGVRAGRPGARKQPHPEDGQPTETVTAGAPSATVRAAKISLEDDADVPQRDVGASQAPAARAKAGATHVGESEKTARKEAEKAERKRVKEVERVERKAARKAAQKTINDAERAEKKARKKAEKKAKH